MGNLFSKYRDWLLPVVLILFILQLISFASAVSYTYAGRAESADHVLTYTAGKLAWDNETDIDSDGAAVFSLFNQEYDHVKSEDESNVVAPGTENKNIVRLENQSESAITYTAVLYEFRTADNLPVEAKLSGNDFRDTDTYPLPPGTTEANIVQAVKGTLESGRIQDFDVSWKWNYSDGQAQDEMDTALGSKATLDEYREGLYIVVEDEGVTEPDNPTDPPDPVDPEKPTDPTDPEQPIDPTTPETPDKPDYIHPEVPKTGDGSQLAMYFGLLCVSGALLIFMLVGKRRENERK